MQTTMTPSGTDPLAELERLAAAFPWDNVQLNVTRQPEGTFHWVAWLNSNPKFGFDSELACGSTAQQVVDRLIEQNTGKRDPEKARAAKVAELKEQIRKLEAVVLAFPPYVPNRELAQRCASHAPIEISSETSTAA